ncbi:unnamed protein product, partial [Prorocentrum cordatum]
SVLAELKSTISQLCAPGKGFLAGDVAAEPDVLDKRVAYLALCFGAPDLSEYVSGVILDWEVLFRNDATGKPIVNIITGNDMVPGTKVDKGYNKKGMWNTSVGPLGQPEVRAVGLNDLQERCAEAYAKGARFAKWRNVLQLHFEEGLPSGVAIADTVRTLARYVSICQSEKLVPIVAIEVLPEGEHDISYCSEVTEKVLAAQFKAFADHHVYLEGCLLKMNATGLEQDNEEVATMYLSTMNKLFKDKLPWLLSFSYGESLQKTHFETWPRQEKIKDDARMALIARANATFDAVMGKYTVERGSDEAAAKRRKINASSWQSGTYGRELLQGEAACIAAVRASELSAEPAPSTPDMAPSRGGPCMDGGAPPLWATLLTAWGATWSACWSWGWGGVTTQAAHAAPFATSGHCQEDSERCSCDWELRKIIDLQQEVGLLQSEVWALRCLLLAGLLLLGAVASGAGTLGFLGPRRRAAGSCSPMADVLTLDIGDPQILVHYPDDENGFLWHHRVLLFRVSDDIWISLTPDLALVRLKLLDIRHEVLERRAPFPAHLGNQVYAHDPIAAAALAGFRRRAKIQGQLLGVGQVDVVERMIWVVAEPRSAKFGEVVDSAIMDDDARGTGFDTKGVAVVDGEEIFVQKIAASKLDDFKKETKADLGDVRTLGDHLDDAGQRCLRLSEAVALMRDTDQPNFPLAGVRSVKGFLESVVSGPGNMTSYQAEWERLSGVGEGSAVNHVHRNLCEVIRLMHSWDQVDASMLASAELIVRWLVQTEIAVERNPRHPDYSGLDIVISAPVNAAGRATTNKFNSWVTDKLKERAQIWKQERLYREEQKTNLKEGKGGDGYDPSKKKLKKRGGKAGAEGAGEGALRDSGKFFDTVRALNQLAAANVNSRRAQGHDRAPEGHLRPTAVQQWMIQNVARRVLAYGDCPTDLTEESSLHEILDSRDHYGMEPKNLASFDFDKVKILHRKVHVRPIRRELPASAAGYLRHASDLIEMDEAELERDRAEGVGVTPYWDPLLRRSRDLRKRLYQRLDQQGLLTWRRRLKGHAGIFVVKKKDGLQRLIIDARAANRAHRPPPTTRLGSSRCMADLDLSDPRLKASGFGGLGSGAFSPAGREGDVGDCFYNFTIPELASWFGFADQFGTHELTEMGCLPDSIWDDAEGAETKVVDGEQLYPCMCAVCMGWSWALYFANEAVTYRVQRALPDGAEKVMREMQPAPTIEPGKCVAGVYVDNVQVIGGCEADANTQMHEIENLFREDRIPFDVEPGDSLEMQSLGLVYHWQERRLRHVARRVWRTYMAGHALLRRRKLHGHALQCWLGHVVNLNQLCPEAMSALNACYRFIEESLESPKRVWVWPSVKSEIRCSMNLLFLMEADLGATYSDQVCCGDSPGRGYALHVTTAEPTELREAWRWRERWRYRDVPTVTGHVSNGLDYVRGGTPGTATGPRTAFGQSLLSQAEVPEDASGLAPSPARSRAAKPARGRTQLHLDSGIPALEDSWVARRRCKLVAADRWRWQDEHINLKEARVALMGLRRHCRSVKFMGTKLLSISDSQVTVGAFEKGRSSAGLQALCRRAAAYRLGGQISWRLRYIETDRNPSDEDSRRWDLKKPAGLNRGTERRDAAPSLSAPAATCQAADSILEHDPIIQFGQDERPRRWRAHPAGPITAPRKDSLIMATVTGGTLERYATAVHEFETYAKERRLPLQPLARLDDSLSLYFVDLFDDGFGVWEGRNAFYGYKLLKLRTTGKVDLPKALASLKGWTKRAPGRMRLPLPDIIVDDIALDLVEHGNPLMGAAVVIQTDTYTRPSETGGQDDSLLVGDVARPWLTSVLRLLHKPNVSDKKKIFDFTLGDYEREVKKSACRLGYTSLGVCPHVFRHSGASNDKAHSRRTLKEVQKRGRWASSASVARYEKGALILQQLRKVPLAKQRKAAERSKRLPQ